MRPAEFDLQRPQTMTAALDCLAGADADSAIIAGGQSLLKQMRERSRQPRTLIDISALNELDYVRTTASGLEIGALTTLATLASTPSVASGCSALACAARSVGDVQIRARGTIGGNVLSGWTGDLGVVLSALRATAALQSTRERRVIEVDELLANGCRADELITAFTLPATRASAFEKLSRRSADPVIVSAAACVEQHRNGLRIGLAVGGVYSHPLRLPELEALLEGGERDACCLARAIAQAVASLQAPSTPHASAAYRLRVLPVIALRVLGETFAIANLGGIA